MRKVYDEQLAKLRALLSEMCETDAQAVRTAVRALRDNDCAAAKGVKAYEIAADRFEAEIERLCMIMIVKQQPVAHDLTFITSAMKMVTDLERISDQAADIAEITVRMENRPRALSAAMSGLLQTAEEMTERCARAVEKFDVAQARIICKTDDIADGLFERTKDELTRLIETVADGETALDLLMVAKYLERICDHAVNVAEWILFSAGERTLV